MKKVLVVTTCFNAEKFIEECIESVQNSKTFDKFEIIHAIVDDKSQDNTRGILEKINKPNIKKFFLDKNVGPAAGRNVAINQIEADYIFALDSDDVIFQNSLRYLFEYLEKNQVEWVYGDFLRTGRKLEYLIGEDYYGWNFKTAEEVLKSMYTGWHFFQQNCMYTKKLFEKVNGFDDNLRIAEDFDLFTKFLLEGHVPHYLQTPLYLHRFHGDNLTFSYLQDSEKLHKADVKKLYEKYQEQIQLSLNDESIKEIQTYIQN